MADGTQELADFLVRSSVGQTLLERHGDLFFENSGQSRSSVMKKQNRIPARAVSNVPRATCFFSRR
jgi:hypothetical protein